MPKKKIVRQSDFPYHISARCNNRDWFSIPLNEVWKIFSDYLYFISFAFEVEIHAFVLMNNHYHLLIKTPQANLGEAMEYFQRETSRRIGFTSQRINHVYGGPYNPTVVTDLQYYINVYKYILRNPVKAGISKKVEAYPYSSLRGLMGFEKLPSPLFANDDLFQNTEEFLRWLNTPYDDNVHEVIRKGLRKKEFKIARCEKTGKLIDLSIEVNFNEAAHSRKEGRT